MIEEKERDWELKQILIEKGYDKELASKCVDDVLEARRVARENYLKRYKGKRVIGEFGGLMFEVLVHDVKINQEGKAEFQVYPLNGGTQRVWIKKVSLN